MADKKYIERGAVLKNIDDYHHTSHIQSITRETEKEKTLWWGIHSGVNYCRNTVIDAPIADVVEVVRCKECRYFGDEDKHITGGRCTWWEALVDKTDFCSYGERKE